MIYLCGVIGNIHSNKLLSIYQYTWEMNGESLISGKNDEIVEEMLPSGSRLKLTARHPAIYTCIVRSQAGETRESCVLSILEGMCG
jgi:hypothetical protein